MEADPTQPPHAPGSIPLIVAVTGHRDLAPEALPAIRIAAGAALDRLAATGCPIVVLSALAAGADQLVADEALARGARLVVPLPMPLERYRDTLGAQGDRERFDGLLARASCVYELAPEPGDGASDDARCYRALARELARCGHVLIALWDGLPGQTGGTGEVVARTLSIGQTHSGGGRGPRAGAVWAIVTPRQDAPAPQLGEAGALVEIVADKDARPVASASRAGLSESASALERYNAWVARLAARSPRVIADSAAGLGVVDDPSDRLAVTIQRYAAADALAQRFQTRARREALGRLGMLLVGLMTFELTTGPAGLSAWMLGGYLALVVAAVWVCRGLWQRDDGAFLECRTLAEHLRVRVFSAIAGVGLPAGPSRAGGLPSGLIDAAGCVWRLDDACAPAGQGASRDRLAQVHERWIDAQRGYFARAIARERAQRTRWSAIGRGAVGLGLVVTAGVVVVLMVAGDRPGLRSGADWALLGVVWLMILAAMVRAYIAYRAFDEHINRYDAMRARFDHAHRAVGAMLDADDASERTRIDRAGQIVAALASEALAENIAWHQLHRERPVEVEAG